MGALAAILPFLQHLQQEQAPAGQTPAPAQSPAPAQPDASAQAPVPPPAPHETKGHQLLQILRGGLVGGLSGLAQNAQTYAATGRNAGIGGGIGAGFTQSLPFQASMQQAELGQKQAQTELTKQQATMVQTPYGPLPATLAKVIFPAAIRGEAEQAAAKTHAGATTEAAKIGAGSRTQAAQIGADARVKAAQMGLGPIAQVPQDLQDQFGLPAELPLKMLNQAESAANRPLTVVQGEAGPAIVNKKTGTTQNLGLGSPRMGGAMEVGDDENPGQTKVVSTAQAVSKGMTGKGSASISVPKAAAQAEVPSKIGDQKVAFSTALQHAGLLRQAALALRNGDERTLAGLSNRAMTEFGDPSLTDFHAIAGAYSREITKMLSAGHMTDAEIGSASATIPSNANYATIDKVLGSYEKLAQSKMDQLNKQKQSAVSQSQPQKKGAAKTPAAADPFAQFGGKSR